MMLAPLRDYLRPPDPMSSPLLQSTKMNYFSRLSVNIAIDINKSSFEETQWIASEDVNVEHLLDIFTTVDANSEDTWDACYHFMEHLCYHKPRLVVLQSKIERLPDNHHSKPECSFWLSELFHSTGNHVQRKHLLIHTSKLGREQGDDLSVVRTLMALSDVNRWLGLYEEGIEQAKEALEISKRLNEKLGEAKSWRQLAWLLYQDGQLDAAEDAVSRALDLSRGEGDQFGVCECHHLLGEIYSNKHETEKAIHHYETALGIASSFNWPNEQFWNHLQLAELFLNGSRFSDAHAHVQHAKSYAVDDSYNLGRAMELQATVWRREGRFEDAKSEILRATGAFEKIGAAEDLETCRYILRGIERKIKELGTSGEFLETVLPPAPVNSSLSALSSPQTSPSMND